MIILTAPLSKGHAPRVRTRGVRPSVYALLISILLLSYMTVAADDLSQLHEKAYFMETAKGQKDEAMKIYREIAATKPTNENRSVIMKALARLQEDYTFPYPVPFETGYSALTNGDAIQIESVRGPANVFRIGGTYRVSGTYTLNSQPEAVLSFYLTTSGFNLDTATEASQRMTVKKGSGRFELTHTLATIGWPHLSFYPAQGGNGLGGLYFGSGEWLRKEPFRNTPNLREKIMAFDMNNGTREHVLRVFGKPLFYGYAGETFSPDTLPRQYIMSYPADFSILMADDTIVEFRLEQGSDIQVGGLAIGMRSSAVFRALDNPPTRRTLGTVCTFEPGRWFQQCPNKPKGWSYFGTEEVRIFFMNDRVTAYYIMDNRTDRMRLHARFRNHGDHTFTDTGTGLTWYRYSTGIQAMNWAEAKAFCERLEYGGHSDWRLPTINELWSLHSGTAWVRQSPTAGLNSSTDGVRRARITGFNDGGTFWSVTPYADDPIKAWQLTLSHGSSRSADKEDILLILPVRGSSHADVSRPVMKTSPDSADPGVRWPAPRFTAEGDETVFDHITGLMWLRNPDRFDESDWDTAYKACEELEAGGYTDWRLPTLEEFITLIDRSRLDPALPEDHPFSLHLNNSKDSISPAYWCSEHEGSPAHAGVASPRDGWTFSGRHKTRSTGYLWPVRDAQTAKE